MRASFKQSLKTAQTFYGLEKARGSVRKFNTRDSLVTASTTMSSAGVGFLGEFGNGSTTITVKEKHAMGSPYGRSST